MKKEYLLVSIVIPTYNHSAYLGQAIDSVLNQDYQNIELIVLDDGSTDDTRAILERYSNCFFWETQKNMGQSATLNKGWSMSKGDILAYLSADDLLMPNAVSRSVDCLLGNPDAVLSYCDFDLIDPESRIVRRVNAPEYSFIEMVTKFICAPSAGAFFWRGAFLKRADGIRIFTVFQITIAGCVSVCMEGLFTSTNLLLHSAFMKDPSLFQRRLKSALQRQSRSSQIFIAVQIFLMMYW